MMLKRSFFLVSGLLAVGLGVLGMFLPLLPTVPFLLLAGFCFARSSPKLHRWLHQHPWFAAPLADWNQNRVIRRPLKIRASVISALSFAVSIAVVPLVWVKLLLVTLFICLMVFIWRQNEVATVSPLSAK
ncbi:hypothetical protein HR45_11950 [Shewanella mangrovi]|uniref:Inner membrane protein n=1 Tax=Shewanella mangrovi TaxID=1515746 RepID=A0A094JGG4_9GAMM|nr:YbaN family protein [Shewanella mangrovi]KFZ37119.1 hypothetical protein HR45_11950 [Shewanella mangrovi]